MDYANPVLYLDYDGVLHPWPVYRTAEGRLELRADGVLLMHVPLLEQLLCPYTQRLSIVLSTLWVANQGYEAACAWLPETLQRIVIGSTWEPEVEELDELTWRRLSRHQQIVRHAERHHIRHWLALDDNNDCWPEDQYGRLVLCDNMRGLGEPGTQLRLAERLQELLS